MLSFYSLPVAVHATDRIPYREHSNVETANRVARSRCSCCGVAAHLRSAGGGPGDAARAQWQDHFRSGRPDGGRPGQRQEAGRNDYGHGRERCEGRLRLSRGTIGVGPLRTDNQGRRLRSRGFRRASTSRPARPTTANLRLKPAPVTIRSTDQCRVDDERARPRRTEKGVCSTARTAIRCADFRDQSTPRLIS